MRTTLKSMTAAIAVAGGLLAGTAAVHAQDAKPNIL
ncbi:hypothetical protein SAMN04515648_2584, partial [Phyllobacterium sp. CL33Tsu]